jgi:hypothetical protein
MFASLAAGYMQLAIYGTALIAVVFIGVLVWLALPGNTYRSRPTDSRTRQQRRRELKAMRLYANNRYDWHADD